MFSIIKSIVAIAVVSLLVSVLINLKISSPENSEETEREFAHTNEPRKVLPKDTQDLKRSPASKMEVKKTTISKPVPESEVSRSSVEKSNFNNVSPTEYRGVTGSSSARSSPLPSSPVERNVTEQFPGISGASVSNAKSPVEPSKNDSAGNSKTSASTLKPAGGSVIHKPLMKPGIVAGSNTTTLKTTSTSSGSATPFTCSANIIGGSFNHPVGVNLSCTYTSTIKYCLGIDTGAGCCNPSSDGSNYTSQIVVGSSNATYCLSYYATSASAGVTPVYEQTYVINTALPDLQVGTPIIQYQTTELSNPGKSFVTSNDFGKSGFGIGQINLKTHDPSASAENLSCEQIVSNYVALPSPTPLPIISLLDVSSDSPATQIQIPLRADQLDYGDNFITSYIENSNYVTPIYSCSTTKVVLSDFDYFGTDIAFGEAGTNSVREFSAGLSSYGFFEPEATVFRGPAGESADTQTGEKLESGLFSIFY